jgi:hypothetical protein
MGTYIDALAALVPAEALAFYAGIVIPNATHTSSVNGRNVTVISNPGLLEWSCAGLLALSSLLYIVGRKKGQLHPWDVLRFFIPPMAFAAWLLVQNPSVWDSWWPGSSIGARAVLAAFVAIVLGIAASALGQQADAMPGVLAVTGVNPDTGPPGGGTNVTVNGSGFTGATMVQFGQVRAPNLAFVDDTQLTVTSPLAAAGTVDVTVTTPAGTSPTALADHFTYEAAAAAPTVTGVNPETGPVGGGTNVTVNGSGFTGATMVQFGQVRAQNLTVTSDTQLTVTSPLAAAGTVDVTVTTPAGTSPTALADHFTYELLP